MVEESSQVVCPITTKLVLDEDEETKEPLVQVHRNLVTKLKPHQVDGKDTMHKEFWTGRSWREKKKSKASLRCSALMFPIVCVLCPCQECSLYGTAAVNRWKKLRSLLALAASLPTVWAWERLCKWVTCLILSVHFHSCTNYTSCVMQCF